MEEDANDKDLVNNVIHDYEKLLKEECDCTKRIIPGKLGMTEVKSFTHHLISYLYVCLCDLHNKVFINFWSLPHCFEIDRNFEKLFNTL